MEKTMMDVVITYVDGLDPLWRADYERTVGRSILEKRFRDWGTLRYLLRGIGKYIPDVRNVYLVVARESQIPSWVDRDRLKTVLHSDIIPARFLPIFNSSSIEMYLHRIEGLSERFLYFNDDFFPMQPLSEDYFYPGGKAAIHMKRQLLVMGNGFRYLVRRSCNMARKAAGLAGSPFYLRPQHTVAPFFKSCCEELSSSLEHEIAASISPLRSKPNFNQYLYSTYMHFKGRTVQKRISNRHYSLAVAKIDDVCAFILNPDRRIVCINDVQMPQERFEEYRDRILEAFGTVFREKSIFEL